MKKRFKILGPIIGGLLAFPLFACATTLFPSGGGTGTLTAPSAGQVLIGNSGNTYTPAYLTPGTNMSIATSSGGITLNANGAGATTTISFGSTTYSGPAFIVSFQATTSDSGIGTSTNNTFIWYFLASSTWLKAANNGSDIPSTSTFRTSLGLGSAALKNVSFFVADPGGEATGSLLYYNNGAWQQLASGTANQILTMISNVPTWNTPSFISAAVTSINGNTNAAQTFTGGTGISVASAGGNTTTTNTGVLSIAGAGCVTNGGNSTGTVSLGVTCGTLATSSPVSANTIALFKDASTLTNSLVTQSASSVQILYNPASSTSTAVLVIGISPQSLPNSSGTFFAINKPTSTGADFVALQINSSTKFRIDQNGSTTVPSLVITGSPNATCLKTDANGAVASSSACLTANQSITLTISGDATGTASGATSIADSLTVTGLKGAALPALATGTLQYVSGTWKLNNATSALGLYDANGNLSSYGGSSNPCGANAAPTTLSASGTLGGCTSAFLTGNQNITLSQDATGTGATAITVTVKGIQTRAVTSTAPTDHQLLYYQGANSDWEPGNLAAGNGISSATSTTSSSAQTLSVNAGTYLGFSGSSLTASTTLASSSATYIFGNATTTKPQSFLSIPNPQQHSLAKVECWEYAAATSTMELYYNTTLASSGIQQVVLSSIQCGINGTSTTSFTTSTIPAASYLYAIVSSTAGTPTETHVYLYATKQ